MAARLKLVSLSMQEQTLGERLLAVLDDGVPRSYAELSDALDSSYASVYSTVGKIINGEGRSPILIRKFARSNRHYITLTKFATKLGAIWDTDMINRPITFRILLQLGGKK